MNSRYYFLMLLGVCYARLLGAQAEDSLALQVQSVVNVPLITDFTLDAIGNIYILTEKNQIQKYDPTGKKRSQFSQNQLGNAASISAANALKLLVWYADFRMVVFLDRSLTQLGGELNLINAGFPEVHTVALAADGNIWLYDEVAFKLRKINPQGEQLVESQNLNLVVGTRLTIHQIIDDGNRVIAIDTTQSCFVFDVFGQFQQQIKAEDLQVPVHLDGNKLHWITPNGLSEINLDFPAAEHQWKLPAGLQAGNGIKRLFPGGIAVYAADELSIWK